MSARPHIPLAVQRDAAILQLGLDPATAELDHCPALSARKRTEDGGYIPEANDPRFLQWLAPEAHKVKTFGRGGTKRVTTAGSDLHLAAKTRRLTKREEEFRRRVLAKEPRQEPKRGGRIPSRPFQKRRAK